MMNVLTKPRMNVDEFLDWAVGRPGHYELFRGEVMALSPETVGHEEIKAAVYPAPAVEHPRARPAMPCAAGWP